MGQSIRVEDFHRGLFEYAQYSDATYRYHCRALPGTALSTSNWMVMRELLDGTRVQFAGGTGEAIHPATDLATVQALFA